MSLHLNQQCQRADASPPPVRLVPGIGCTDQEEARNAGRPKTGPPPVLEAHICAVPKCVNGFLLGWGKKLSRLYIKRRPNGQRFDTKIGSAEPVSRRNPLRKLR